MSSLASMACCLPFGFIAALGAVGASAFLLRYRFWFLVLSFVSDSDLTDLSAGASAVEKLLSRHRDPNLRVLVVWEPVLATDWSAPSRSTLARISDHRVRQFWDPKHVVSQELIKILALQSSRSEPACCMQKGFYWDDAIFYEAHSRWKDSPASIFWNGPVVRVIPALEELVQ